MLRRLVRKLLTIEGLNSLAQQIGFNPLAVLFALGALGVGWITAAVSWAEGTIHPWGTLGYVVVVLAIALLLAIVFISFSFGMRMWQEHRGGSLTKEQLIAPGPRSESEVLNVRDLEILAKAKLHRSIERLDKAFKSVFRGLEINADVWVLYQNLIEHLFLSARTLGKNLDSKFRQNRRAERVTIDSIYNLFDDYYSIYKTLVRQLHDSARIAKCDLNDMPNYREWKESDMRLEFGLDDLLSQPEYNDLRRRIRPTIVSI